MRARVIITDFELSFEEGLSDLNPLLKRIKNHMIRNSKASFTNQGLPGLQPWVKPPKINRAGIISDFNKGALVPRATRYSGNRKALMDTKKGMNSITGQIVGDSAVEVYSPLPYMGIHMTGGVTQITKNKSVNKSLGRWMRNLKLPKNDLRFIAALFHINTLTVKVPKRIFLGFNPRVLNQIIENYLKEISGE